MTSERRFTSAPKSGHAGSHAVERVLKLRNVFSGVWLLKITELEKCDGAEGKKAREGGREGNEK